MKIGVKHPYFPLSPHQTIIFPVACRTLLFDLDSCQKRYYYIKSIMCHRIAFCLFTLYHILQESGAMINLSTISSLLSACITLSYLVQHVTPFSSNKFILFPTNYLHSLPSTAPTPQEDRQAGASIAVKNTCVSITSTPTAPLSALSAFGRGSSYLDNLNENTFEEGQVLLLADQCGDDDIVRWEGSQDYLNRLDENKEIPSQQIQEVLPVVPAPVVTSSGGYLNNLSDENENNNQDQSYSNSLEEVAKNTPDEHYAKRHPGAGWAGYKNPMFGGYLDHLSKEELE